MNWKLIGQLSLPGLLMAFATVFWISSQQEPFFWVLIFLWVGYMIAKKTDGKHFLYGFLVSIANSVWITGAHIALAGTYLANHPQEAAGMPMPDSPRLMMLVVGPVIGILSGVVLGLTALVAGKIISHDDDSPGVSG